MNMYVTPSAASAAFDPPAWLREDMQHAEQMLPGLRMMVLFQDDLPAILCAHERDRREDRLRSKLRMHWATLPFRDQQIIDLAAEHSGRVETSAQRQNSRRLNPLTNEQDSYYTLTHLAHDAVIMLPRRDMGAISMVAQFTGTDAANCVVPESANLHRLIYWHEVTHVKQDVGELPVFNRRSSEKHADAGAIKTCTTLHDTASVTLLRDLRAVDAFTDLGFAKSSDYWYSLGMHGVSKSDEAELASMLELKTRCATPHYRNTMDATGFIHLMLSDKKVGPRRSFNSMGTSAKLANLQRVRDKTRKFSFPHTPALADIILNSARRLAPGATA